MPSPPGVEALEQTLAVGDLALRDRVLAEWLPALAARDPAAAAHFAESQGDARTRELCLLQVAMTWARADDAAAVHWAESLSDPRMRDAAITDISLAVAERNPAHAVALRERFVDAMGLRFDTVADNTLVNLAHQWAVQDFGAALAWANAQPPGVQRDQVLERLVFVRAAEDDLRAAAELAATLSDAGARQSAVASVAQQWQLRDPDAAREWARSLEAGSRARALAEIPAQAGS